MFNVTQHVISVTQNVINITKFCDQDHQDDHAVQSTQSRPASLLSIGRHANSHAFRMRLTQLHLVSA